METKKKAYIELAIIAGIVIIIDQITKYYVRTNLAIRETWMPLEWLAPYARFVHWQNTGVAFGMFQGKGWVFTLIGLAIVMLVIFFFSQVAEGKAFWRVALAMQLGGAIGNLIDRFVVGYVVDFIWVGNFPVFNIADSAICIGAAIMIIGMWTSEESKNEPQTVTDQQKPSEHSEDTQTSEENNNV